MSVIDCSRFMKPSFNVGLKPCRFSRRPVAPAGRQPTFPIPKQGMPRVAWSTDAGRRWLCAAATVNGARPVRGGPSPCAFNGFSGPSPASTAWRDQMGGASSRRVQPALVVLGVRVRDETRGRPLCPKPAGCWATGTSARGTLPHRTAALPHRRGRAFWPEAGVRWGSGREGRLMAELDRLARFAGCDRVELAPDWLRETVRARTPGPGV